MNPLTVVCWKWTARPGYRSQFTAEHVNVFARMVARHYQKPHRVVCITDDAEGIDEHIGIIPLWNDYADLPSPHGGNNPSCYRRLKMFSAEAREFLGERFVSIDLDCVIVGDLSPIFERPEDFVMWGDTSPNTFYNGSLVLMTAGARRQVWEMFDPVESPRFSVASKQFGSDQGWIGACLGPDEAKFSKRDGVYSYRIHIRPNRGVMPHDARLVFFHGQQDPWGRECQSIPWIKENWR